jgi:hypothetical protein
MPGPLIRDIVIVGGGTAGWMTAAALSNHFKRACSIRLVESDEIGIVGVGEATIPHIVSFNRILGIDEDEFLRATRGTFKLGIEFVNWSAIGDRYTHGFGKLGPELDGLPFHHFWLRGVQAGVAAGLGDYSINTAAPRQAKFMRPRPDMKGLAAERNRVRVPLRRRAVRPIPAPAGRAQRRRADRGQDRQRAAARAGWIHQRLSCWPMAAASKAGCSSTVRACMACSSRRRCKRATTTGRTGCPATARSRSPAAPSSP